MVKFHRKIYYYIPNNEKQRVSAKLKALNALKYPLWHEKYINDFPSETEEFFYYAKKIDVNSVRQRLYRIEQFEKNRINKTNRSKKEV